MSKVKNKRKRLGKARDRKSANDMGNSSKKSKRDPSTQYDATIADAASTSKTSQQNSKSRKGKMGNYTPGKLISDYFCCTGKSKRGQTGNIEDNKSATPLLPNSDEPGDQGSDVDPPTPVHGSDVDPPVQSSTKPAGNKIKNTRKDKQSPNLSDTPGKKRSADNQALENESKKFKSLVESDEPEEQKCGDLKDESCEENLTKKASLTDCDDDSAETPEKKRSAENQELENESRKIKSLVEPVEPQEQKCDDLEDESCEENFTKKVSITDCGDDSEATQSQKCDASALTDSQNTELYSLDENSSIEKAGSSKEVTKKTKVSVEAKEKAKTSKEVKEKAISKETKEDFPKLQTSDTDNSDYDTDKDDWEHDWFKEVREPAKAKAKKAYKPRLKTKWSDADTREYRQGYPGKRDNPSLRKNLQFYKNEISSRPDGGMIDEIHEEWFGDYRRLEAHHGYIQWLFPIREKGMNYQSQELQSFEAEKIREDEQARKRVLRSYEMMLDFYGIRLVDPHHGKMERAKNWQERFRHLNRSYHNYLRITRILKSLGELGFEYLKAPFLEFIMREAFEEDHLTNCQDSCLQYWIHTLRDDAERQRLLRKADQYLNKIYKSNI